MADDRITMRPSGAVIRGPVFEQTARQLAEVLELAALMKGGRVLQDVDIKWALEATRCAKEARVLEALFASWANSDPGPAARLETVMKLRDLEVRSEPFKLPTLEPEKP